MATLPQILKSKIGKNGVSKTYVANLLGVSEKTIENYMRGLRQVKPGVLVKLSKALNFELSELSEQNVPIPTVVNPNSPKLDDRNFKDKYIRLLEDQLNSRQNRLEMIVKTNQAIAKTLVQQVVKIRAKIERIDPLRVQSEVNKSIDEQLRAVEKAGNYL